MAASSLAGSVPSARACSMNTDTEAKPSLKTRCSTGPAGSVWRALAVMRNPGGRALASQETDKLRESTGSASRRIQR